MTDNPGLDKKPLSQQKSIDVDSPTFREQSVVRVHALLNNLLTELRKTNSAIHITEFLISASDTVNRIVTDSNEDANSASAPDTTAIIHKLGLIIWEKPPHSIQLETDITHQLAEKFLSGQIDASRFSQGEYFLQVLMHKYTNGNGRTARALKKLIEVSPTSGSISIQDTKKIVGVEQEVHTQKGETSYTININPDFDRLRLGIAYFGLEKGLTPDQVIDELKLPGSLPEQALDKLASKLGIPKSNVKKDFIHFMTVRSDLSWCDFGEN